jgi:FtsZ-binding cell division protein ZapB
MNDDTLEISNAVRHAMHGARQTIERLTCENDELRRENNRLKREVGMVRLLADMRSDLAQFELSADGEPLALLRRQAD